MRFLNIIYFLSLLAVFYIAYDFFTKKEPFRGGGGGGGHGGGHGGGGHGGGHGGGGHGGRHGGGGGGGYGRHGGYVGYGGYGGYYGSSSYAVNPILLDSGYYDYPYDDYYYANPKVVYFTQSNVPIQYI